MGGALERRDRRRQRIHRLLGEEHGRRRLGAVEPDHRLPGATTGERDRRPSRRRRLQRSDAEILDRREQQGAAARVEVGDLGIGAPAEEADARPGHRSQSRLGGAAPDDQQAPAQAVGRGHREVDALVGPKAGDLHRRMDHGGGAAVHATDALGDVLRDRHELVDAVGLSIPPPQRGGQRRQRQPRQPAAAARVGALEVPHVAHRREAVAEVQRAGGHPYRLGHAVAQRDHEVVAVQGEAAHGEREQGQVVTIAVGRARQALHE